MPDKLTQQETEEFYDISAWFDEFDPGIDAFNDRLIQLSNELNAMGGQSSMSYRGVLVQLNEVWEHLDHTAKLTGKVYIADKVPENLPSEWDGPYEDGRGTFFIVDDAEVISLGIVDANEYGSSSQKKNVDDEIPVKLAYGFSLEASDSDVPMFYAAPEHLLSAIYAEPTYDAIVSRLHQHWPQHMRFIMTHLESTGGDPLKLVRALERISRRVEDDCIESTEFKGMLQRYLIANMNFDTENPYAVTLQGEVGHIDAETDDVTYLTVQKPHTHSLYVNSIGSREYKDENGNIRVDLAVLFEEPTSQFNGEGIESRLLISSPTIRNIQSTRPLSTLKDMIVEARYAADLPEITTDADPEIELAPPEMELVHVRILEERRLERYEALLQQFIKVVTRERSARIRDRLDALDESARLCRMFAEQLRELHLEKTDILEVNGGVYKGISKLRTGNGKFHIDVDEENPIGSPGVASDPIIGYFEGLVPAVDMQEDDNGPFWLVAPRIKIVDGDIHQTVLATEGIEYIHASAQTSVAVNLDGTATYNLPHLEMIRRRRASLAKAALSEHGTQLGKTLMNIQRGLMNERPDNPVVAKARLLKSIRTAARRIVEDGIKEDALDALREQLSKRLVTIKGEAWVGGQPVGMSHVAGALEEVVVVDDENGPRVMASVEINGLEGKMPDEEAILVALDSLMELTF